MIKRFHSYINKVFDFKEHIQKIEDSREKPDISSSSIWLSGLFMFILRMGSLNAIDIELRLPKRMEKLVGKRKPSGDSIGRVFDGVVADSLYLEAPFINCCLEQGKHVIAVMKSERRLLMQDAEGVFKITDPIVLKEDNLEAKIWDSEGFESLEGVTIPLRVLHSEEKELKRRRKGGRWRVETEEHSWWWATTIPKNLLPSPLLWRAGHSRWDIENDLFNDLANHWFMDHCFKHEPKAIVNFLLTLFVAFALMQCFYKLNLKPQKRTFFTLISIATQFLTSLADHDFIADWLLPAPDS